MGKLKYDIVIGQKFNRLTVVEQINPIKDRRGAYCRAVKCKCDCGNEVNIIFDSLRNRKSCGCLKLECITNLGLAKATHKLTKHPLYQIWVGIKKRCQPNLIGGKIKGYEHYGGKGIRICKEWEHDFLAFYNWAINNGYAKGLIIDRKKNNKNYCPINCRWVTIAVSNRNTSKNIYVGGLCLKDYCEANNLKYKTIFARIKYYGYSVNEAIAPNLKKVA